MLRVEPKETAVALSSMVLIVEDDADLREAVADALRVDGYRTVTIGDGNTAIAYLTTAIAHPERHELPDVIICDLALPGRDGLDVLDEISAWIAVPMIVMTGLRAPEVSWAARHAGASLVLHKPVDVRMLRCAVHQLELRDLKDNPR